MKLCNLLILGFHMLPTVPLYVLPTLKKPVFGLNQYQLLCFRKFKNKKIISFKKFKIKKHPGGERTLSQITLQVLLVILFLVFVRSLSSLDFPCRSCFRECGFMCWSLRVSDCELEAHIIFLFFVVAVVSVFFFCL